MRKVTTLLIGILLTMGICAQQQIANAGFEDWSGTPLRPTGWDTWESITNGALSGFAVKDTTQGNFVEGKSAIRLTTDSTILQGKPALLAGIAEYYGTFTGLPDTLKFFYKYTPVANDSSVISINTYRYDTGNSKYVDYLNGSVVLAGTSGAWYSIFVPLEYQGNLTGSPDSILLTITSSKGFTNNGAKGSVARFDNIRFTYKTTVGIQEAALTYAGLKFFPNPAATQISFDGSKSLIGHELKIYSLEGKEVLSIVMSSNSADVSLLNNGLYIFEVNRNGSNMLKGKFNVCK